MTSLDPIPTSDREAQALREVGVTVVSRPGAAVLAATFLLTILAVPAIDLLIGSGEARTGARGSRPALAAFGRALARAAAGEEGGGARAVNRRVLVAIQGFEDRLEEDSWLRSRVLPPVQRFATRFLGTGNEQVYPGRDGWLFYRSDVDHVAGRPFMSSRVLERRRRAGEQWQAAPQPDPVAAIVDFAAQLEARGIGLMVVPTPVKPMLHAEKLSRRFGAAEIPRNPSFEAFRSALATHGIAVFDPAPALSGLRDRSGQAVFLETDTHWTPAAVETTAEELAARLVDLGVRRGPSNSRFYRQEARIEARGDIQRMLLTAPEHSRYQPQTVGTRSVLGLDGGPWRSERSAQVLVLGDSFTNIYSEPVLGWGTSAGLAEQLAFFLQAPVDRIAVNAGGAHTTREALARQLRSGRDRLAGKKVVVYQFAARELSQGDWKLIDLPAE